MAVVKNKSLFWSVFFISFVFIFPSLFAKEGMWIPATLKKQEAEMKRLGLSIPIEQLYNEDGTALNNAVVLFGRGCTGELISGKGLLLTNHHCGYGTVQGLSDTINDYFAKGFFATSQEAEKRCPGLTVTFIRRVIDVTATITDGLNDTMTDAERDTLVLARIKTTEQTYKTKTGLDAAIKPYFEGNQYWLALTETYTDIRLVGFPPNGIGTFGGDDENWVWPRHTGDFSVFRVYAGKDNRPAAYAVDNTPYRSDIHFKINAKGYREGDMTMVYGFPGTTAEYISSFELNQVYSIFDPISIAARTQKLEVWSRHMDANREVYLKYTSKRAGVANGWKKWQGELEGLKVNHAIKKKMENETAYRQWANSAAAPSYAKDVLPALRKASIQINPTLFHEQHIKENVLAIEMIQQAAVLDGFIACFRAGLSGEKLTDTLKKLAKAQASFFKNYDLATDKEIFETLMPLYMTTCAKYAPQYYKEQYNKYGNNVTAWANAVYTEAIMGTEKKFNEIAHTAQLADSTLFTNDPARMLYTAIADLRKNNITPKIDSFKAKKHYWNRLYMKTQMTREPNKAFYPDANLTLRLAYGTVQGLDPDGPAGYAYQTQLGQAIALDNSGNKDWYKVPTKLKELYKAKDFGRWGVNNDVPLAFVATNHTSGGNSGSPVLNARGELIGTNFDRAYEGTMSDYLFDPNRCRNITVDIRYTLFVIEKFGGPGWLLNEMDFVK